jgi:hypothetical protein
VGETDGEFYNAILKFTTISEKNVYKISILINDVIVNGVD